MSKKSLLIAITSLIACSLKAQLVVDRSGNNGNPDSLLNNILITGGAWTSPVTFSGDVTQIGYFNSTASNIGLSEGVIMATGDINVAIGSPGNFTGSAGNITTSTAADPDLTILTGGTALNDVAVFEFDIKPGAETIEFRYVFASEEYNEYTCSNFNDVFGFFISGPGISGPFTGGAVNIAQVPGKNIPVMINTVNNGVSSLGTATNCSNIDPDWTANSVYFVDNELNTDPTGVEYDGFTIPLTAKISGLQCGAVYHIKLAVADAFDSSFDSAVLLEAGSFETVVILEPEIGADTNLCIGQSLTLDPGLTGYAYKWSTGETTETIDINSSGKYWVEVSHSTGCSGTDTIDVQYADSIIQLTEESSLCSTNPILLDVGPGYSNVSWSDGSTTPAISVTNPGIYSVSATDVNDCPAFASKSITKDTLFPSIEGPEEYCMENGAVFIHTTQSYDSVVWNTGVENDTIKVLEGIYSVEVFDNNNCRGVDTFQVKEVIPIPIEISGDTSYCEGDQVTLRATTGFEGYAWNNGDSTNFIRVGQGDYSVIGFNSVGCLSYDTVKVNELRRPKDFLTGFNEVCTGDSTPLTHTGSFSQLMWNNGSTLDTIQATPGMNILNAQLPNGCWGKDTIIVYPIPYPTLKIDYDSFMCLGTPEKFSWEGEYTAIEWSEGVQVLDEKEARVFEEGVYSVKTENKLGCPYNDTIEIKMIECFDTCKVFIPNTFSPNNDLVNDFFGAVQHPNCIMDEYLLQVFNRWGDKLWQTENLNEYWDGSLQSGDKVQQGVYIYKLMYQRKDNSPVHKVGHVNLLK